MRKEILIIIGCLLLLLIVDTIFLFGRGTEKKVIPVINDTSEIPENKSAGDCWNISSIGKIICFNGQVNVTSGKVTD